MTDTFDFNKFKANLSDLPSIPGTKAVVGSEFWYFETVGDANNVAQFQSLLDYDTSLRAKTGGISLMNCEITPPKQGRYLSIAFRGDLHGWRSRVEESLDGLNLRMAKIENDQFVVLAHKSFPLKDCEIRFFKPERSTSAKPKYREDIIVNRGIVIKA